MGKVIAVCTSERKGIQKTSVPEIKVIENYGYGNKNSKQQASFLFDKLEESKHGQRKDQHQI